MTKDKMLKIGQCILAYLRDQELTMIEAYEVIGMLFIVGLHTVEEEDLSVEEFEDMTNAFDGYVKIINDECPKLQMKLEITRKNNG